MSNEESSTTFGIPLASEFESRIRERNFSHEMELIRNAFASADCMTVRIELKDPIHEKTKKLMELWGYSVQFIDTGIYDIYRYDIIPASVKRPEIGHK